MSFRLAGVEGEGCRSLADAFSVTFPRAGLVRVSGASGAGKSTLLSLPAFVLGHGPPATKLRSWSGEDLEVKLFLDRPDGPVIVTRGTKLKIQVDGKALKGNAAALEEELRRFLGVPLEVVQVLGRRRQGRGSAFLVLPDERKKTFLAGQAGIEELEGRLREGKARVAQAQARHDGAVSTAEASRGILAHYPVPDVAGVEAAHAIAEGQANVSRETLRQKIEEVMSRLAAHRDAREQVLRTALSRHEAAEKALLRSKEVLEARPEHGAAAGARRDLDGVREALSSLRAGEAAATTAAARRREDLESLARAGEAAGKQLPVHEGFLKEVVTRLAKLREQDPSCPTCDRPWPDAPRDTSADERRRATLAALVTQLRYEMCRGAEAKEQVRLLPAPPASRVPAMEKVEAVLHARAEAAAAAFHAVSEEVMAAVRKESWHAAQAAEEARKGLGEALSRTASEDPDVSAAKATLQAAEEARAGATVRLQGVRMVARQRDEAVAELVRRDEEVTAAVLGLAEQQDALEAVRAFVAKYFDEMLQEVSDEANAIMGEVPNLQRCSIRFSSDVLDKDGNVTRRAIVPILTIDGHDVGLGDEDGASGGMVSAVHLAVDLAVLQVLERRGGWRLTWLCLDEPFDGLDEDCRKAVVEILRQQGRDRLILVTDHMGGVSGLYDQTFEVVIEGGRARILLASSGRV